MLAHRRWSLVIWDRASRTLHLGRDYMGTRPLCYRRDRDGVVVEPSLRARRTHRPTRRVVRRLRGAFHEPAAVAAPHAVRSIPRAGGLPACRSPRADVRRTRASGSSRPEIRYRDARACRSICAPSGAMRSVRGCEPRHGVGGAERRPGLLICRLHGRSRSRTASSGAGRSSRVACDAAITGGRRGGASSPRSSNRSASKRNHRRRGQPRPYGP